METRNAAGLQTAGARMCRIATAALCRIRMRALLQDAAHKKYQLPAAQAATATILM